MPAPDTQEGATTFSPHVVGAARRVVDAHRLRLNDAHHASSEWESKQTFSSAIRRDDAKAALLELSDANTVALAVLEAVDGE